MMCLEFRDKTRFTGDHINNHCCMITHYLCLKEDSHRDGVKASKRPDTIILESVKNGLMTVACSSKRNRCHLHKRTVFMVLGKVRVTRCSGERQDGTGFPMQQTQGKGNESAQGGYCSRKDV